jgi:hypothetical protein
LTSFVDKLLTEGVAVVAAEAELPGADAATESLLAAWEQAAREELSGQAPAFLAPAALWAAEIFYHACRCVSCRDIAETEMTRLLQKPCPVPRGAPTDWSVDLIFRQLPTLHRLARHLSQGDPLVQLLLQLALRWPLSSVGVALAESPDLSSFIDEPSLKRLYVDRILETGDVSRLGDPRIDDYLRAALGAYPELCPGIARKLFPADLEPSPQNDEVAPG